jgi:hypothetical protein
LDRFDDQQDRRTDHDTAKTLAHLHPISKQRPSTPRQSSKLQCHSVTCQSLLHFNTAGVLTPVRHALSNRPSLQHRPFLQTRD